MTTDVSVTAQPLLGRQRPAWDALVDAAALPSPFLRSWWLENTSVGRPMFVLVRDGDSLIGGLALQEDRLLGMRRLRFMGSGPLCPDHLDLVCRDDRTDEVVDALRDWFGAYGAAVIDLAGLRVDSLVARSIEPRRSVVDNIAPYLRLEGDFDAVLAARRKSFRSNVRRRSRRFDERGVQHRIVPPDDIDGSLAALRDLHRRQWGDGSGLLRSIDRVEAAVHEGIERGELALHELYVNGTAPREVIVVHVVMQVAGRASYLQGGRRTDQEWDGAGTVLFAKTIADACAAGCHEYDFLRGAERYKSDWSTGEREVLRAIGTAVGAPRHHWALASIVGWGVSARVRLRPTVNRVKANLRSVPDRWRSRRSSRSSAPAPEPEST